MLIPNPTFSEAIAAIRTEYERLGHVLGWRFLCVSKDVLEQDSKIVFLTLNPGGRSIPEGHPSESCEAGPSYLVEQWWGARPGKHKLQRQVQALFESISRLVPIETRPMVSMEASLIAYFIPFRSPRIADLHHQREMVARKWLGGLLVRKERPGRRAMLCRPGRYRCRVIMVNYDASS
jgi:hypothetical protein